MKTHSPLNYKQHQKLSPIYSAILLTLTTLPHVTIAKETQNKIQEIETIKVEVRRNQANSEMTYETQQLMKVAGIAGDPLAAVFSMPGVVYADGDDGGEPAIRGSSPDDNAFYIDDMPVDYIFHLFGDSIFNENIVQDFSLHPAAFGSQYGNATGGVFDVKLRDPRNQDLTTTVDWSLLKTGIMVEGGVTDDQAFYFSYRRSLLHLFINEGEEDEDEPGISFYKAPVSDDYQGKYQWLIGNDHKLTLTFAGASDGGGLSIASNSEAGRVDPDSIGDLSIKSRFDSQNLSWQFYGDNHKIMHLTFGHSIEKEKTSYGQGQFIHAETEIFNSRFLYQIGWIENHTLVSGIDLEQAESEYSYDAIIYFCTDHDADCESTKGGRIQDKDTIKATTSAIYLNDIWTINNDWQLQTGMRAEHNSYIDQSFILPRLSLSWFATPDLTLRAKAGSYSRFPDIDTVLRKIGNPNLNAPEAKHYSFDIAYEFADVWQTTIDIYYKDLSELPRSINDGEPNEKLHYSNDLSGSATGVEWLVKREKHDGWYGWASISWSKSNRTDNFTNKTTQYYLDTPLMFNLVGNYELNERWDFGVKLSVRSGAKYTPIIALRENPDYPDNFLPVYGELNSKDLPVYHRLDLQANYKTTLWGQDAEWTFALLNATGSDNITGYFYAPDGNETLTDYKIEGEEGMDTFPSIGLKIQF